MDIVHKQRIFASSRIVADSEKVTSESLKDLSTGEVPDSCKPQRL